MKEQLISLKTAKIAKEKGFNICFQPTQSLLQKWLREEHLKIISIVPLIFKKLYYKVTVWEYCCVQETKSKFFETYEKALEAGIEEALTLI